MGRKAAETIRNINNTFGPETTNECTVQWWVKEFCKGDKSLKDEEPGGWPSEVDSDQWSAITEADLRAQWWPFCGHSAFEAGWKGEKST